MDSILLFLGILFLLGLYFLPSIVATKRQHHNKTAIIVLNILLGWTFLGWVGSLIWALTQVQESKRV